MSRGVVDIPTRYNRDVTVPRQRANIGTRLFGQWLAVRRSRTVACELQHVEKFINRRMV